MGVKFHGLSLSPKPRNAPPKKEGEKKAAQMVALWVSKKENALRGYWLQAVGSICQAKAPPD